MHKDDLVRLRHMLDASKEAASFAAGKSRSDLDEDRMLVLSLVKEIEILGEAANKVSADTRSRYSEIPWLDIVEMRNRLIHGYFDVNLDIVWETVATDLPPLIAVLQKILA